MKNQLKKVQDIIALLLEGKQMEYKYKGEEYEWRLIDDWITFSWIVQDIEDIEWQENKTITNSRNSKSSEHQL